MPPQDLTLRIAAQNEALAELEKTRAQVVSLMQELQNHGARVQATAARATEGLASVRRGMEQLAAQATGVEGPIGRIASGLLMFGTGGLVTLGVVAGIGAIAGAYQSATQAVNDLREANEKASASFQDVLAAGRPNVTARRAYQAARIELEAAQAQLTELRESRDPTKSAFYFRGHGLGVLLPKFPATTAEIATQQQTVDVLTNKVHGLRDAWQHADAAVVTDAARRRLEDQTRAIANAKKWLDEYLAAQRSIEREFVRTHIRPLTTPFQLPPVPGLRGPKPTYAEYSPGFHPLEDYYGELPKRVDLKDLVGPAINMLGSLRGGVAGAFAGASGVLAQIPGPWAAITSGLSALTTLFGHHGIDVRIQSFTEQALSQLRNTVQFPTYLSEVITGANNPEALRGTRYQQGRMTARDAVPRTY